MNIERNYFVSILLIILLVLISACKKENPVVSDCVPIPPYQEMGTGYNYILDSIYYTRPYFNPNNPNEIIFVKEKGISNKLIKYNLLTKDKQILYEGTIIFQPKWGKNDWILLNLPDANIWKIKSNGDSLTRITSRGGYYQPEWNSNSDKIVFYESFAYQNYFISDINGNILDSFPNNLAAPMKWYNDSLIFYQIHFNIYCLNINARILSVFYSHEANDAGGILITKNADLIFSKTDGIFSINLSSKSLTKIKSTCNSKVYMWPTYSSITDKIIWQRLDYTLIDKQNVFVKSRLLIMNSDGTGEVEIVIN